MQEAGGFRHRSKECWTKGKIYKGEDHKEQYSKYLILQKPVFSIVSCQKMNVPYICFGLHEEDPEPVEWLNNTYCLEVCDGACVCYACGTLLMPLTQLRFHCAC